MVVCNPETILFFLGWLKGHHIWKPTIRHENKRQEDTMSHIETRNPIGSVESAGCDLPFWALEIFEALRKVSQIEIQSTVSPETNVIISSSTNLCLTSCISRSLPPKMKHPEMDMCNSWCQNLQILRCKFYCKPLFQKTATMVDNSSRPVPWISHEGAAKRFAHFHHLHIPARAFLVKLS